MPLTDTQIRNAKPRAKPYRLFDGGGLYLEISPAGGRWWRYKYRFNNKEKRISLGTYPDTGLKEARNKRFEARKLVAAEIDPSENRKSENQSRKNIVFNSFEASVREWLVAQMSSKSASHRGKVLRRFELYVFPWIGSKPIGEITAPQILECVRRVQNLNKLETAHRILQACGQVFRYAVQTGRAVRDVTPDLKGALPPPTIKHMAAFTEPQDVAELLRAIDGFTGTFTVQAALRLAPLVFVRPSELRTAKWADINLDTREWRYRVSKTKIDHLVPLSIQATEILKEIFPFSGHGEFVFIGGHDPKKPMSEAAINAALRRMGYDTKTQITGHGFRAIARTLLSEQLGIESQIIEHQLAHRVPDPLGEAYNRTKFIKQRREMMQAWADYLDDLKQGAKVLKGDFGAA